MNVVFLDFDGVLNIPYWHKDDNGKLDCDYGDTHSGLNHYQAIQWVSEFCEIYDYSIVITSTWRKLNFDCVKCLYDSGLRESVKVIGETPVLYGQERGDEITAWLLLHPEVKNYLIFDDDTDMGMHNSFHLVKCNCHVGFMLPEYNDAVGLHNSFSNLKTYIKNL